MNLNRRMLVVALLTAATTILAVIAINAFAGKADDAQQAADTTAGAALPLADQVTAACKAGGDAAKALSERGLCIQASDTKDTIKKADVDPTPAPPKYLPPDPAQLAAMVQSAVFRLCGSDGSCQGDDGKDATDGQVLKAVQQLIDGAVLRACGGSCVSTVPGPKGDTGAKGDTGEPGVGLTGESHCDAQGRFVFGLTDGSEAVVDGSRCRQAGVIQAP